MIKLLGQTQIRGITLILDYLLRCRHSEFDLISCRFPTPDFDFGEDSDFWVFWVGNFMIDARSNVRMSQANNGSVSFEAGGGLWPRRAPFVSAA